MKYTPSPAPGDKPVAEDEATPPPSISLINPVPSTVDQPQAETTTRCAPSTRLAKTKAITNNAFVLVNNRVPQKRKRAPTQEEEDEDEPEKTPSPEPVAKNKGGRPRKAGKYFFLHVISLIGF